MKGYGVLPYPFFVLPLVPVPFRVRGGGGGPMLVA